MKSSSELILTDIQSRPRDVTSRGRALNREGQDWAPVEKAAGAIRYNASWVSFTNYHMWTDKHD